jgi:SOS-response transcriptional repressors (RecA-mediated autopeptidases)
LDLLRFSHARVQRDGVSPSFDEMKEALDLRSKSGIHRLITALEERGFIRRLAHRARAIEVLRLPEGAGEAAPRPAPEAEATVPGAFVAAALAASAVPLMGRIAAGTPITALQHREREVGVPSGMLGHGREHYALDVKGYSMIKAGIHDGYLVVIARCDYAQDGEITVALVEDYDATLNPLCRHAAEARWLLTNSA